jgi:isoquinoline 1-oxidoreductase subunit beta
LNPSTVKQEQTRSRMSRRAFLISSVSAGGALVIAVSLRNHLSLAPSQKAVEDPFEAWIHIHPKGKTEIVVNKSEMGQGVWTALPMLFAEEAEIDWDTVSVVQSDQSTGTGGSGSVLLNYIPFRQAGATVREVMLLAAARHWQVGVGECVARKSQVLHRPTNRTLSYGSLIDEARKIALPRPESVRLKDPADFTLIGKATDHLDIPLKVQGKARFGIDVRVPGMLFATVAQCPTLDGALNGFDPARSLNTPGVLRVFEIESPKTGGEVAVVATSTWAAIQGRKALQISWKPGAHQTESSAALSLQMREALDRPGFWSWSNSGENPDTVPARHRIESIYEFPFLAHATMEPMNTTVHIHDKGCEVWAPTQSGTGARRAIAKALGIPEEKVLVHVTFIGGGFGRRFGGEYERQAALIAKEIKRPVQLVWTREDDMTHDVYRPACVHRLRGGIDDKGRLVAWSDKLADPNIIRDRREQFEVPGAVEIPYPAEHFRVSYASVDSGVPRGAWRSVGPSFNGFAVECFVDELAHAAGIDPYEFRRRLLLRAPIPVGADAITPRPGADSPQPDPRLLLKLLEFVVEKVEWKKPLGQGRGRGLAVWHLHQTYLAQVAEVTVSGAGIRVNRIVTALDCGQAVNPNGVRAQIEGGTLFALSAALKEAITVKDGTIQQQNFNDYELLRLPDAPDLETFLLPSQRPPGGIGEAAVPGVAASVANAVFAATGKRMRKLPFRLDEVHS